LACAKKIEWNKELFARLQKEKSKLAAKDENTDDVQTKIDRTFNRVNELESKLKAYANFDAEFSDFDGDKMIALVGKRKPSGITNAHKLRRVAEISKAKRAAKATRANIGKRNSYGGDANVTPVQASLNPEIGDNRIVIPPEMKESFSGGNRAIENLDDFESTKPTKVELSSGFGGSVKVGSKINWVGIGIGVVLTGAAIWAINKYKIIDKIVK